jgi:hypothetical protein
MPPAVAGEFAFAASGTCLVASGGRDAWFGSGGGASRAFHSRDGGLTWTVTTAPIPAADAGGVFSLAFRSPREGVMVGGDPGGRRRRPLPLGDQRGQLPHCEREAREVGLALAGQRA